MIDADHLNHLDAQQVREVVSSLMGTVTTQQLEIERRDHDIAFKQAVIDKIKHEMAVLKRLKFAARSEAFSVQQKSLLEEAIEADLAALQTEPDCLGKTRARRTRPSVRDCRRTWPLRDPPRA